MSETNEHQQAAPVRVQPVVGGSRKWIISHAPRFRRGGVGFVMRGPDAGNCNVEVTLPANAGIAKCERVAKAMLDALNAANNSYTNMCSCIETTKP